MALDDAQWPCIECRIKEEHFKTYRAELESRIHAYKKKYLLSDTLIEKYKEKCIECENLYQQLEKCVGMLANYKWRMGCALRTTFPMRSTLKETRDELIGVQAQLIAECEARNATHQHSTQLQSQVLKLEEKISQLEKGLEESEGTAKNLQRQLKSLNQAKVNLRNKREHLKLIHKGLQVEGGKINKFKQEFAVDVSEDEGISSLDRASICSSLDSRSNSVADVFMDVAVCHSPGILPKGHLGVYSKDKSKQLCVMKGTETSETDVHKDTSFHNQDITNEDSALSKRPEESEKNGAKPNNSWSLHCNLKIEGKKHENQTSECDLVETKSQTNKILPLLDPSAKQSHSSAVAEKSLENCTKQQNSLPSLTIQTTGNEDREMCQLPSTVAENEQSSALNGPEFQNQIECCKAMSSSSFIGKQHNNFEKIDTQKINNKDHENALQTDQISVEKHNHSLQSNSSLSADDINNLTLKGEIQVVSLVGITSPECENLSKRNAILNAISKDQKENSAKEDTRSIFDAVEMKDCAPLETQVKPCASRPETVSETSTDVHEKLKEQKVREHVDDCTEDFLDNILLEMTWQCSLVSPLSDLAPVQGDKNPFKENKNCNVAVGTEHLVCDAAVQTTEEHLGRKVVKLHDIVIQTENVGCNKATQTCAGAEEHLGRKVVKLHDIVIQTENVGCNKATQTYDARDQRLHNKKDVISVMVQTDVHALMSQHSACCIDSLNTVDETPCRTMNASRKNNIEEAYRDPGIKESLNSSASCNLNHQSQWPGQFEDDIKDRCCSMHNMCSRKDIFEHYNKLFALHQQYLQLSFKMMEQQHNMFTHSQPLSSHSRMPPVFSCGIDHHFKGHYVETSKQMDGKNADHLSTATQHISSKPFRVNSMFTSGDCLCCNKNLANKECSRNNVGSNNSIIKSGNLVEPKHENNDETSVGVTHRDNSRNCAQDREENASVLEKRVPDSDNLFGFISDLSSDDDKGSCKTSKNYLSLRKRAVESDSEGLVEHSSPLKMMRKRRFKRIRLPSSDEDDLIVATNVESNKPAFKTTPHGYRIPTESEKNKPVKNTVQCSSSGEDKKHSSGKPIPSKTLKTALKKNNKISKLEKMRLNIVKAKTRVKIPRATPERVSQRLKKKSVVDVQVSNPAKKSREVKKSCVSQSNSYSVRLQATEPKISRLKATEPKISQLKATEPKISASVPSMRDYESVESLQARQIPGSNTVASAKLSTERAIVDTFKTSTKRNILYNSSPPLHIQVSSPAAVSPREVGKSINNQSNAHSSQSVLSSTAPKGTAACVESEDRSELESTKFSQIRETSASNTVASAESSLEKFEANAEEKISHRQSSLSLAQLSTSTRVIIPLNSQRINMNDPSDSVHHTEPGPGEKLANCRSNFNTESKTVDCLLNKTLSPPLAEAKSPQKINENELGGSTDKLEQQSHESNSNGQNKMQKAGKDNALPRGSAIQWALQLLEKEVQQERKKQVAFRDCSRIKQRVKKALKELESETFDNEYLAFIVQELTQIGKPCVVDFVARFIVKAVEMDSSSMDKTHTPPAPALTVLQQRLMALTFTLLNEHQKFKELPEKILLVIEYKTLRLGSAPKMDECWKLVCFYSAICRALKDVKRVQLYCLDALYSLHYKSAPILNAVLCTFPEALPHADKGKDIPLVKCLVFLIFAPVQYKKKVHFSIKPLKDLLHQLYGYEPGEFNADKLLAFLLNKLRIEENKEVPIALILLAKRMSHEWTYRTLLCKNLIPLVNEWKDGKLQNGAFAKILPIIGYIIRCFPVGESRAFIEEVKYMFINFMEDKNAPAEVQEGAVMGLISLSRHNPCHIANILKQWQPKVKLSSKVVQKIAAFMQFRPLKFWTYANTSMYLEQEY